MKKKLLVTLTALATGLLFFQSCNTKETAPSRGESEFVEVTLTLDEAETKTVNAQEKTLWDEGDRLTAILASCGEQDYSASYLTYRGDNRFTGRVTYPSDDNDWYLIYPYREDNVTPHKAHITVGKEMDQTGNGNMAHIAGPGFPLTGKALDQTKGDAIEATMRNVLSHLVFQVTNTLEDPIVVKQVVFSTSKNISGDFVGDMTNDNIAWTAESGASKSVTLNVLEGAQIAKGETAEFHSGILPAVESGDDMKVKIVAVHPSAPQTEIVYYKTYKSDRHLISGKNYTFKDLNVDTAHSNDPLPGLEDPDDPSQPGQPDDPTPSGESAYVKVTSEPTTWDGTYLIVDESSSKAFAAFSGNASSYAVNVTISDGKIAATSDVAKYAFTISDAGVKHANATSQEAYNIRNSEGKYIFWSSSTLQILDTNEKTAGGGSSSDLYTYYNTLAYSSNGVQVMSSGHSSGFSKYYLGYASGAFDYDSEGESRRVQLYKFTEGGGSSDPTKQNQNLSFAQSTVTLTMATAGGTQAVQTVSGNQTSPVTYSSSNTGVATVSGTTITIHGFGSTTITATAPESSTYNSGSASYTLTIQQSGSSTTTAYTKATSLTVGGTYVIVDVSDTRLFKGATDGSYVSVSPSNGVISDPANSLAAYEFTVTQSGSKYCLVFNDGKYLLCDYSNSGDSTTGLTFVSSQPADNYLYDVTVSNSVFEFSTAQRNSTSSSSNHEVLYYKTSSMSGTGQDKFKIGASGAGVGVHLYLKTSSGSGAGKQNQTLSFAQSTVTRNMATASGTMDVQSVSGAQTDVTYSSTNTTVATVSGTTITIKDFGTTTITATAAENSSFNSASASYTLVINQTGGGSSTGERTYTYQSSVSAGTYLIGGYESDGSKYSIALFPTVITGNWNSSQGTVTNGEYIGQRDIDSSNTLTFNNDSEIFNAEVELIASGSNWKIKILSTGQYLTVPSQDNRITYTSSESSATAFTIGGSGTGSTWGGTSSGNTLGIYSGSYYFYHSGSAQGFSMRAYTVTNIRLYKKTSEGGSSSGKQNQTLSFAQSTVSTTASAGSTMSVQTVSGAQTSVTYSSSNPNVATVSGTNITITGVGSTTITATAAASDTFNSGSASYTLVVSQSGGGSSTGERTYTYVAPNNLQEGTYLIAGSETDELSVALFPTVNTGSWNSQQTGQVSNGQYVPHKVYGSSNTANTITTTDSAIIGGEVELVKNGNNWRILVKANSQYLASPSAEYRISFTSSASSAANFSISSGTNGATVQTGSYYFYHSGSASGFTLRTNSTSNLRFYKLTSGGDSSGKQYQSLSFTYGTETYATENASGTYPLQQVNGAQTSVTYSSSNTSVATINGNNLNITGFGSTTITANAVATDAYYSASASYTLTVKRTSQTGVYNLENEAIEDYLDRAISNYTASNHSSTSYVSTIRSTYGEPSATNRTDWPAPATVTWTQSSTGSNRTLAVYYDEAHTNEEIMAVVELGSTSADIYNLIPGKTYYWVLKSGNSTVASGHFETEGRRRMMAIGQKSNFGQNYANNCRDLGGQVTTSGKKIKYGKIYRGSNMDSTTDAQKTYLKTKMNIGLDVDLRTSGGGYGWGQGGNSLNNALGFTNDIAVGDYNTYTGHTNEEYSGGSDLTNKNKMGPTLMRIMNAVHNNVNVYVHCMVGADRTGGTCLYMESLLGIAPERCDMDFEMTSFSCVGSRTRNRSANDPEQYYTVYNAINNTSGSTWQEKAINYCVNTLGVDRDLITQFQTDMLE